MLRELSKAKVDELGVSLLLAEEHVLCLKVSVHNVELVEVLECLKTLSHYFGCLRLAVPSFRCILWTDRATFKKFCYDVQVFVIEVNLVQVDDIWMIN